MKLLSLFLTLHLLIGNLCPMQMVSSLSNKIGSMEAHEEGANELAQNSTIDCSMGCFRSNINSKKDSSTAPSPIELKGAVVQAFQPFPLGWLSYIEAPPGPQSDHTSLKKIIGTTVLRI